MNSKFDFCFGNFGLLASEDVIDESCCSTIGTGGVSLFNRVCGSFKLYFGNCQLAPSSIWRDWLGCVPLDNDPYIWINQSGKKVLWFERIASPVREAMQEAYIRQPLLFRWICDKKWLNTILKSEKLYLNYTFAQEKYPN